MREGRLGGGAHRRHGLQIMSFEQAAVRLAGGFARPIDDESCARRSRRCCPPRRWASWRASSSPRHDRRGGRHPPQGLARGHRPCRARRRPSASRMPSRAWRRPSSTSFRPGMMRPPRHRRRRSTAPRSRPGGPRPDGDRRPHRTLALLAAAAAGAYRTYSRAMDGRPADAFPRGWKARASRSRAPQRKRRGSAPSARRRPITRPSRRCAGRARCSPPAAEPSEIAIATASPADYDDHFLALRADANIDLHFVHGVKVTATREGQAAAALADIVVRGLSQIATAPPRGALCGGSAAVSGPARRLAARSADRCAAFTPSAWNRLLARLTPEDWPDGADHAPALRAIVELLAKGPDAADEIGEAFLKGRALAIWRKALLAGPAASIDATLETLKQDDGLEACVSVAWMPASALAASPRRFVRLLGLNSSRWPRGIAEDRLISGPHHPDRRARSAAGRALADRRDFETILATTDRQRRSVARPARQRRAPAGPQPAARRAWRRNLSAPQRGAGACLQRNRPPHGPAPGIRRRSASGQRRKAAGATGGAPRSPPMTGSFGRIIRSFSPSSAAPSRPARFAACCAIR